MGAVRDRRLTARGIGEHRRALLATSAALLVLVFAMWAWLRLVGPLPGDRAAARWWVHWHPSASLAPVPHAAVELFNVLGTPLVAAVTVLGLALLLGERLGRRWAWLVVAAAGVVVLNAALKLLFGPTPLWIEARNGGHNFPSGHVAYATSLLGLVGVVALDRRRRAVAAGCLAIVVAMGVDRVVGKTHLPSDVIAGYAVGAAWLGVVLALGVPWASADRRV